MRRATSTRRCALHDSGVLNTRTQVRTFVGMITRMLEEADMDDAELGLDKLLCLFAVFADKVAIHHAAHKAEPLFHARMQQLIASRRDLSELVDYVPWPLLPFQQLASIEPEVDDMGKHAAALDAKRAELRALVNKGAISPTRFLIEWELYKCELGGVNLANAGVNCRCDIVCGAIVGKRSGKALEGLGKAIQTIHRCLDGNRSDPKNPLRGCNLAQAYDSLASRSRGGSSGTPAEGGENVPHGKYVFDCNFDEATPSAGDQRGAEQDPHRHVCTLLIFDAATYNVMQVTMSGPLGQRLSRDTIFFERPPPPKVPPAGGGGDGAPMDALTELMALCGADQSRGNSELIERAAQSVGSSSDILSTVTNLVAQEAQDASAAAASAGASTAVVPAAGSAGTSSYQRGSSLGLAAGTERPFIPYEGPVAPAVAEAVRIANEPSAASKTPLLDELHGARSLDKLGLPLWRQVQWDRCLIVPEEEYAKMVTDQLREKHGWEGKAPEGFFVKRALEVAGATRLLSQLSVAGRDGEDSALLNQTRLDGRPAITTRIGQVPLDPPKPRSEDDDELMKMEAALEALCEYGDSIGSSSEAMEDARKFLREHREKRKHLR